MEASATHGERHCATELLPDDVVAYLREVRRLGASHPLGVFQPRGSLASAWPWLAALTGGVLLGFMALAANSRSIRFDDASNISLFALICGTAIALLASAGIWWAQRWRVRGLGSFEFLGPSAWWVVGPMHVHERPWRQLVAVDGQHRMQGNVFLDSRISVRFSFGQRDFTSTERRWAESFYRFADAASKLAQRGLPEGMVGTIARAASQDRAIVEPEGGWPVSRSPTLPAPREGARGRAALRWAAALAVVASTAYAGSTYARHALPEVAGSRQEAELHRAVTAAAPTDVAPAFEYLRRFPAGAHASEVRGILERQLYASALAEARKARSIAPMQKYIAARPHSRLVPQARAYIRGQLAEGQRLLSMHMSGPKPLKPAHRRMADVLAALLAEAATTAEVHVIVTARESSRVGTTSEGMRRREREFEHAYVDSFGDMYTGGNPEKWDVRSTVSLVPTGEAFDEAWKVRRQHYAERRIAERLSALPGGNMLRFDGATTAPVTHVDVAYHLRPSGEHVRLNESGFMAGFGNTSMMREYVADWRITVRSSEGKVLSERRFTSERPELASLNSTVGDPKWGRYAMTLMAAIDGAFVDSPGVVIDLSYEYSNLVAMN